MDDSLCVHVYVLVPRHFKGFLKTLKHGCLADLKRSNYRHAENTP